MDRTRARPSVWFDGVLKRFAAPVRDRSGVAAVELAFILPAMIALLLIVVEFGTMLTAQGLLDAAALRASRTGTTGFTPTGTSRETFIRNFVAQEAYGLLDAEKLTVTAKSYASFGDIDTPGKGTAGFGGSGQVVKYQLSYPWQGITGTWPLISSALAHRSVTLSASVTVRNESW